MRPPRVYLAGPLFTVDQRALLDRIAETLRASGYECFVPHEHELADHDPDPEQIFQTDWRGLEGSQAMVAVVDGPDVDSGTAAEMGIFTTWGRPIIAFSTDLRVERLGVTNQFIAGLIDRHGPVVHSIEELLPRLEHLNGQSADYSK